MGHGEERETQPTGVIHHIIEPGEWYSCGERVRIILTGTIVRVICPVILADGDLGVWVRSVEGKRAYLSLTQVEEL